MMSSFNSEIQQKSNRKIDYRTADKVGGVGGGGNLSIVCLKKNSSYLNNKREPVL